MRYLAYTKRIQYSEKKCIRTRLDTCKNSCYSSLQPIRFGENRGFEARIVDETSRNLRHNSLSYAPTQNHPPGGGVPHLGTHPIANLGLHCSMAKKSCFLRDFEV